MAEDRELDVVVYGATGFVGKLTAAYLARSAPAEARIGLGGRNRSKLEGVRAQLGERAADWPLVIADSADAAALAELAASATAVATTVGPYQKYGMQLAKACAAAGTHYADLTGETLFMRETIRRLDGPAKESGARIVHTCGFDSIPSDLGVLMLHEAAGELEDTTFVLRRVKGGISGGTVDSMKTAVDQVRSDRSLMKVLDDPYALSPARSSEPDLGSERDLRGVEHAPELGGFVGPFLMAPINTRVVRRSNALQDWAYGRRFRYREVMSFGDGLAGRARATAAAGAVATLPLGLALPPTRFVLDKLLPEPGEGPSDEMVRTGFFQIEIHGRTPAGDRRVARVAAQGDPGYGATAVMLAESALCLALDGPQLPERAGVLTPATAMGITLVERLRAARQTYEA
ncbi:MAG TPA: saccharopine dehydrogenase NADP-binding domain-containing protein [Thermoleophilaceae bacterium]|nr:saccharopine dehydrogenase NADP-binding domain-containing protein [Thermoleophilaceae bacterium]